MEKEENKTLSPEEQIALLANSVDYEEFIKRVNQAIKELSEILQPIVACFLDAFKTVFDENNGHEVFTICRDPRYQRIVWLALYHPKERVRKKNIRRIKRIAKRMGKIKKEIDNETY